MSSYTVINDVGDSFRNLIDRKWGTGISKPTFSFDSPKEITVSSGTSTVLSIFLFEVSENTQMRNREPVDAGPGQVRRFPLPLDLLYLLTPFASSREDEKKMIGKVMQILYTYPVIPAGILQGDLADSTEEVKVMLHPFTLDDLTKIWNSFQEMPFRFSVGYLVTPVFIDPLETVPEGARVVDTRLTSKYVKREED